MKKVDKIKQDILQTIPKITEDLLDHKSFVKFEDKLNNFIHFQDESEINSLLDISRKQLDVDHQIILEKIIQTQSSKILVTYNNKKWYVYSLKFIPISVLHEDPNAKMKSKLNKKADIEYYFKKRKLIDKNSEVVMMDYLVSQSQLEQIKISDVSNYLKTFIEGNSLKSDVQFPYNFDPDASLDGLLYIPLIFMEPLDCEFFDHKISEVFHNNQKQLINTVNRLQNTLDEIAVEMCESQNMQIYPNYIYDPFECLEMSLNNVFYDMCFHILSNLTKHHLYPHKICLIKEGKRLHFTAYTKDEEDLVKDCFLDFPAHNLCIVTMEMMKHQLVDENQVRIIKDEENIVTMKYIGNLH